jgi:hypothetical protein
MVPKPTGDAFKTWLINHGHDGVEPIVKSGRVDFQGGFLQEDLYDLLILRGASLAYTKSELIQHALILLLEQVDALPVGLTKPDTSNARFEYRGYLSVPMHQMVAQMKQKLDFNNSELLTLAAQLFLDNRLVNAAYRNYIGGLTARYRCTVKEAEQAIFGWVVLPPKERKLLSRLREK